MNEYKFEFKNGQEKYWIKIKNYISKHIEDIDDTDDTVNSIIDVRWRLLHRGIFIHGEEISKSKDGKIVNYMEKILLSEDNRLSKANIRIEPIIIYYTADVENKIITFTDIKPKDILDL